MLEIKLAVNLLEFLVEYSLTAVTERCVSDIVAQSDGSYEICIKIQCASYG